MNNTVSGGNLQASMKFISITLTLGFALYFFLRWLEPLNHWGNLEDACDRNFHQHQGAINLQMLFFFFLAQLVIVQK